jgi:predicted alpha/beta superfamily hydrolase
MKNLILIAISALFFISCQEIPKVNLPEVTSGKIIRLDNFKSEFVNDRDIDIWLPDGYSEETKYNVLYMHDGQMLYDANSTWNKQEWGVDETLAELINQGKIEPCIVVGIFNDQQDRHSDYFPQKPFEALPKVFVDSIMELNRQEERPIFSKQVQSDAYLKFLVEEVKPYIDKHFSVKTDAAHTFVAGSSMGGLISMYAICEYPDVFGGAACLSTHWPGIFAMEGNPIPAAFQNYMSDHLPLPSSHKIYFDYGTETLDAMYEPPQLGVDSVMRLKGFTEQSWITKKFPGHDHSEKSWKERLHIPLEFIKSK